ncbi:hypothetical protein M431DRAFT_489721 [Trichoderma harzianum CBS 226.95]|uniref:Restriction endonuclease type IV Mrr domain-containing protein n=1 Tax=Trichoderma harzianum CBS 226.95 TaxID=983964 RepID=A0A2T4AV36_TRIHA|nr:hypothetical protein M431DRAFT_489721 [Trichoderma harzianum CBS 226.95]PTB60930.1 hypothetical protein M431DRAFT_489721 [Trichoderma harzianum CBS 226.95]
MAYFLMSQALSATMLLPKYPHSDLESFLEDAKRRGLDEKSPVFTGTRYEYLVLERLRRYGFSLRRIGGASDFGVDLVGEWTVPSSTAPAIKVLVQCKGGIQRVGPHMIRELEGSFAGAPAGWRGQGVLGLLVAEKTATKGMRDALGRAGMPMGYFCCEGEDGVVRQMLWNQRAEEGGLEGVDVALRRGGGRDVGEVVLVKNGEPLPFV